MSCGYPHEDPRNACASGPGWHREYNEHPRKEDVERLLEVRPGARLLQGQAGGTHLPDGVGAPRCGCPLPHTPGSRPPL